MARRFSLPLSVQIATATLLTLLVAGLIVAFNVRSIARSNTERNYANSLKRARLVTQARLETLQTIAQTGAVVLAQQQEFTQDWERGDLQAAIQVAQRVGATAASTFQARGGLTLYDPSGHVLFDTSDPAGAAGSSGRTAPSEVLDALNSTGPIGGMRVDPVLGLTAYGVAVVHSGSTVIGLVELENGVDSPFAVQTSQLTGTLIAFFGDGKTLATSSASVTIDPGTVTAAEEQHLQGEPGYVAIGGRQYLSALLPIQDRSGRDIAYAYAGVDGATVLATVNAARTRVVEGMLIAAALGLVLSGLFTVLTVRPLRGLVRSAQRIQANDLESPVSASGPSEARQLAEALDEMRLAIRQSRESLLMTNRRLAEQIDASSADLTEVTSELTVLHAVVAQLGGQVPGGLAGAAEELLRLPWADGSLIALADEHQELVPVAQSELDPATVAALLAVIRAELPGRAAAEGLVVPHTVALHPELASHGVISLVAMPMLTPEGIAGVVAVTSRREATVNPAQMRLLESVAHEVASVLEISELSDEVEESRRIAEAVLREMSDGVVLLDSRGVCRACNPSAAQLLGRARGDVVGRPAEEFLPLAAGTIGELRQDATGREPTVPALAEVDGHRVAITFGPFTDVDPSRSGTIVLLRDLSAEAEAERVKQDFVSMVGHELRTPLTLIRTSIDLLREQDAGDLNETQARIVGVLQGNSDRLMSLISDLLDMSALDSGRVQIAPEATDLADVVATTVEEMRASADAKQLALAADLPPGGARAWADRSRIQQVLSNLLSNAIKYTPEGGHVITRVREAGRDVRVEVQDNGIGIPPEEQGHLFEKFFRTTAGRRTTGGTGLGLAIARSIVELHGGRIWCDSDGEHGSTFVFTVPRQAP